LAERQATCKQPVASASTPRHLARRADATGGRLAQPETAASATRHGAAPMVGTRPFDPFPYGLLTMVVSLEAIFLSTFVLISQNRLSEAAEHRADLDLHIGLLTEYELTRVLHMLHAIQDKMGIANDADSELADLEMETTPEDVLAEIERLQQRALSSKNPLHEQSP
jgi:hypothetical protein